MSGSTNFTAGAFNVVGFDSNSDTTGAVNIGYAGTYFNAGATGFLWNWQSATDANTLVNQFLNSSHALTTGITGPVGIASTNYQVAEANTAPAVASTEGWKLSFQLTDVGTKNLEGTLGLTDGTNTSQFAGATTAGITTTAVTASGTGANALSAEFRNLQITGTTTGFLASFAVTFTLTDTTTSQTSSWSQYVIAGPCYAAGTRIAVPGGEVAVERLAIGDLVATLGGTARPVKWIGHATHSAAEIAAHRNLRPVIVRAGALADGMPHRDLRLSPMHALLLDDALVPAAALVNGVSILREEEVAPVSYFHIELEDHDIVFAEGAPAETYVDDASRMLFDNADEYAELYGAWTKPGSFATPRIEEGIQIAALRHRLAARAGLVVSAASGKLLGHAERITDGVLEGWAIDQANPAEAVSLEVFADGESVGSVIANRYRVDLDHAGLAGGRGGFTLALPAAITSLAQISLHRATDGTTLPVTTAATETV